MQKFEKDELELLKALSELMKDHFQYMEQDKYIHTIEGVKRKKKATKLKKALDKRIKEWDNSDNVVTAVKENRTKRISNLIPADFN